METDKNPEEPDRKALKKRRGPAEKRKRGELKEPWTVPLENVWQKAISKNLEERGDGREGLSLLWVLFEHALDLKAEESGDPLDDLDSLLASNWIGQEKPLKTVDEFAPPLDRIRISPVPVGGFMGSLQAVPQK